MVQSSSGGENGKLNETIKVSVLWSKYSHVHILTKLEYAEYWLFHLVCKRSIL